MLFSRIGIPLIQILETRNSVAPNLEYNIHINNQTHQGKVAPVYATTLSSNKSQLFFEFYF
jgi:hypothetical protein